MRRLVTSRLIWIFTLCINVYFGLPKAGVGFAIKSHLVSKLSGLPKGLNDRLMTLRLSLSGKRHATIVSAYAPTMTSPDEVKDKLYDDLDSVITP